MNIKPTPSTQVRPGKLAPTANRNIAFHGCLFKLGCVRAQFSRGSFVKFVAFVSFVRLLLAEYICGASPPAIALVLDSPRQAAWND